MNRITYYALTPQDAWFFRDGRPYNKEEFNQADAVSQFPPSPRTITGAFRAALARANGWKKGLTWDFSLNPVLGHGPDDLGALQGAGPFLLKGSQPLFPAPLHLLGKTEKKNNEKNWNPATLLRPAKEKTLTDMGEVFLPEIDRNLSAEGLKPAEKRWMNKTGYQAILAGKLPGPADIAAADTLWQLECRVGLQRDASTLQTEEGALYSPALVRLCRDVSLGFGAGLDLSKLPEPFDSVLPTRFPLGGESRMALCEQLDMEDFLPSGPDELDRNKDLVRFIVIALTPVPAREKADISTLLHLDGVECVCACAGKPVFFGGWNSIQREPVPLEPFHPAGSVWFCEAPEGSLPGILALHGTWIGARRLTAHGFGQILIGRWPRQTHN
jgi:CRISPR-associated protein Cmr3